MAACRCSEKSPAVGKVHLFQAIKPKQGSSGAVLLSSFGEGIPFEIHPPLHSKQDSIPESSVSSQSQKLGFLTS